MLKKLSFGKNVMLLALTIILTVTAGCGKSENNKENVSDYPSKEIELIVPFGAGGGTDRIARLVANSLQAELGKPVVVVNKTSAAGVVGSNEIAAAKKDGYTLGVFSNTDVSNFVYAVKTGVNFELDSFTYLGGLNETGDLLIVPRNSDINSLEDFVSKAKQNPGNITVALPSRTQEVNVTLMESAMDIDITGVVYESGNNVLADLIGGHTEAGILSAQFADQASEQGLKVLGIMLPERLEAFPDIPTFKEQNYEVNNAAVRLLVAPAGLPEEITAKIEAALTKAYQGELSTQLSEMGEVPKYRNVEQLKNLLDEDFKMREEILAKK